MVRLKPLSIIVLALITVLIYLQVGNHQFKKLDDQHYVTENRNVSTGISWHNIVWAFTQSHASNWHPVTWISHMIDCHFFGLNPKWHHLNNALLHLANTLLLLYFLFLATDSFWKSFFVAALFATHPLHVESVAWVAERKDLLSMLFGTITLIFYCRYVYQSKRYDYILAILFFSIGLMSKPMLVTLPFVLLLLDYWPLNRIQFSKGQLGETHEGDVRHFVKSQTDDIKKILLEKVPFFCLSAVSSAITIMAQKNTAMVSIDHITIKFRLANAIVSYLQYIYQTFWPTKLAVFYPIIRTDQAWHGILIGSIFASVVLLVISYLTIKYIQTHPYLFVGWFWYVGTLVPVIGIIQVGMQAHADRYTYIPLIGIFIIISWGLAELQKKWKVNQKIVIALGCIVIALLTTLSYAQVRHWRNHYTLFKHASEVTKDNYIAFTIVGTELANEGRLNEAIKYFSQSIKINKNYVGAHYKMGLAQQMSGRDEAAIKYYEKTLRLHQYHTRANINLGFLYQKKGELKRAEFHYKQVLKRNPFSSKAHYNLGTLYFSDGKYKDAIKQFQEVLSVSRGHVGAHYFSALAHERNGNIQKALVHLKAARNSKSKSNIKQHNIENKIIEMEKALQRKGTH